MAHDGGEPLSNDWAEQSMRAGFRLEKVNALACPKGQAFSCEMTGLPATVQMVTPYITLYYATEEHAHTDWKGIMHKVCPLLGPLRAVPPVIGSEEERARRQYNLQISRQALINLTSSEARKYLVRQQYELVIPGAVQCLRFSMEVYGDGHMELVPAYLLLAEANLGLSRWSNAEHFLSMANWTLLKNPETPNNVLFSQLFRDFGKLYSGQGKFQEALWQFSNDVYHCSLEVGPEHINTAGGYFEMATVFENLDRMESALALFDKVVDVWYKYLVGAMQAGPDMADAVQLGEAQVAEAVKMLTKIQGTREDILGTHHIATGESSYTLGLLYNFLDERKQAKQHMTRALAVYEQSLGKDHHSTKDVTNALNALMEAEGADM